MYTIPLHRAWEGEFIRQLSIEFDSRWLVTIAGVAQSAGVLGANPHLWLRKATCLQHVSKCGWIYIYIYIYMYIYVYIYTHTYIYLFMYLFICLFVCIAIFVYCYSKDLKVLSNQIPKNKKSPRS